jgi:hypothetical protein
MRSLQKKPLRSYTEHTCDARQTVYGYEGCLGAALTAVGGIATTAFAFAVPDPTFATKLLAWISLMGTIAATGVAIKVCFKW